VSSGETDFSPPTLFLLQKEGVLAENLTRIFHFRDTRVGANLIFAIFRRQKMFLSVPLFCTRMQRRRVRDFGCFPQKTGQIFYIPIWRGYLTDGGFYDKIR
jgi:hypothetical protein